MAILTIIILIIQIILVILFIFINNNINKYNDVNSDRYYDINRQYDVIIKCLQNTYNTNKNINSKIDDIKSNIENININENNKLINSIIVDINKIHKQTINIEGYVRDTIGIVDAIGRNLKNKAKNSSKKINSVNSTNDDKKSENKLKIAKN